MFTEGICGANAQLMHREKWGKIDSPACSTIPLFFVIHFHITWPCPSCTNMSMHWHSAQGDGRGSFKRSFLCLTGAVNRYGKTHYNEANLHNERLQEK